MGRYEHFPREVVEKIGALGFLGVAFPEDLGGGGADTLSQALVVEALSRFDASIGLTCAAHMSLSSGHIERFGADEHRQAYVPEMIAGKKLGAWCLTEPSSGSDAAAMRTRAVRDGDRYRISREQDVHHQRQRGRRLRGDGGHRLRQPRSGISAFVMERGTPGLSNGRKIEKLGLRASDTAEVIFDNAAVPARNLIGEPGQGYRRR